MLAWGLAWPAVAGGAADHFVPSVATPTLAAAVAASAPGDVIEIDAALYKGEKAPVTVSIDLDIQGVNGQPRLPPLDVDGARVGLSSVWLSGTVLLVDVALADLPTVVLGPDDYAASPPALHAQEARVDVSDSKITDTVDLDATRFDLARVVVTGNAAASGPAIGATDGRIDLDDVRFEDVTATGCGGALFADGVEIEGRAVVFDGLSAGTGGGICLQGESLVDLTGVTVDDARAIDGGFLWASGAPDVTIDGLVVRAAPGGVAAVDGGVAWVDGGSLSLSALDVSGLAVLGDGAVVHATATAVVLAGGTIEQVQADGDGGVAWVDGGSLAWTDGTARQCAATDGSVVHAQGAAAVLLRQGWYEGNDAVGRGTIHGAPGTTLTVERSRFCANEATTGSGLAIEGGHLADVVSNTVFLGNRATDPGVGATVAVVGASSATNGARVALRQIDFVEDVVGRAVVYTDDSRLEVSNSIFFGSAPAASEDGTGPGVVGSYDLFYDPVDGVPDPGDAPGFPGSNAIEADPAFQGWSSGDCAANLWLSAGSPARDAGDPTVLDADGSRSDVGAFGGPDAGLVDGDGDGVLEDIDCDDAAPTIFPGAPEVAHDGIDQDCDGSDLLDGDGDGFAGTDCDDGDDTVFPGATEVPYDGVDQDCDGADLVDVDGDGFDGWPAGGTDCDDGEEAVNPDAVEIWYDGTDQDCDGNDADRDLDGFAADLAGGTDCDDDDDGVHPGGTDIANDAIDQDCDGYLDGTRLVGTGGFGCRTGPPGPPAGLLLPLAALAVRRRRRHFG